MCWEGALVKEQTPILMWTPYKGVREALRQQADPEGCGLTWGSVGPKNQGSFSARGQQVKGECAPNLWREGREEIGFCYLESQDQLAYRVPPGLSLREGAKAPNSWVSEGQDQYSWSP